MAIGETTGKAYGATNNTIADEVAGILNQAYNSPSIKTAKNSMHRYL